MRIFTLILTVLLIQNTVFAWNYVNYNGWINPFQRGRLAGTSPTINPYFPTVPDSNNYFYSPPIINPRTVQPYYKIQNARRLNPYNYTNYGFQSPYRYYPNSNINTGIKSTVTILD